MTWAVVYLAAVLAANYTATWFIPLPGFGAVAVGTLLFGLTFTARDYVHRRGRRYVYALIAVAAGAGVALSLAGAVPPRIIAASVAAIIISESADTEIYQRLLARRWWVRVAGSNAVSVPLDTALFNLAAFAGALPGALLLQIIVGEVAVKYAVGLLAGGLRGVGRWPTVMPATSANRA